MALTVNLIGPSPWGFRIFGGRDFKKAITISKVLVKSFHAEPSRTVSNHILCFCKSTVCNGMSCKVNFLLTTTLFLSLFVFAGCSVPISFTAEAVGIEWKQITLEGSHWLQLQWKLRWEVRGSWFQSSVWECEFMLACCCACITTCIVEFVLQHVHDVFSDHIFHVTVFLKKKRGRWNRRSGNVTTVSRQHTLNSRKLRLRLTPACQRHPVLPTAHPQPGFFQWDFPQ